VGGQEWVNAVGTERVHLVAPDTVRDVFPSANRQLERLICCVGTETRLLLARRLAISLSGMLAFTARTDRQLSLRQLLIHA
jgi:hypothetical protein